MGTHRALSPEQTKRDVSRRIRASGLPVYEKIIRLDRFDGLGIPVYAVKHSNRFRNCFKPSWGKGLTEDEAYVSGLMERVERYSACDADGVNEKIIYAPFGAMKSRGALPRWRFVPCNLQRKLFTQKEVDEQSRPWTRCFSLTRNKPVYVPANLVFFKSDWCQHDFSDTTGLASGNTLEEAIVHALCEIIERHLQDTIYWNRIKVPTIDLGSIRDAEVKKLAEKFMSRGVELRLSYLSGDFHVPAISVLGFPRKRPYLESPPFYASVGVHPDKRIALMRALTELAQARACALYQMRELGIGESPVLPSEIRDFFNATVDEQNIVTFDGIKTYASQDFLEDIKAIVSVLRRKGCEVIVKELTHKNIGIPVVRVIVTGLQPGIFGISIMELNHKAARISKHLDFYPKLVAHVKDMELVG